VPGAQWALIDGGELAHEGVSGLSAAGGDAQVTTRTLFQACSISKPVAVTAMLRLVERGLLDLDEDVNERLTSWRVRPLGGWQPRVTLRQLASHSAGLTTSAAIIMVAVFGLFTSGVRGRLCGLAGGGGFTRRSHDRPPEALLHPERPGDPLRAGRRRLGPVVQPPLLERHRTPVQRCSGSPSDARRLQVLGQPMDIEGCPSA
jgi:hypothetical protein